MIFDMKYLFAWIGVFIALFVVMGFVNCGSYYHLLRHGIYANGVIVGIPPKQHGIAEYIYGENGVYAGRSIPGYPNPDLGELKIGDSVVVYYSSINPKVSMLSEPRRTLRNEVLSVFILAAIGATFILLIGQGRTRRR